MGFFVSDLWGEIIHGEQAEKLRSEYGIGDLTKLNANHILLLSWFVQKKVDHCFGRAEFSFAIPEGHSGGGENVFSAYRYPVTESEWKKAFPFNSIGDKRIEQNVRFLEKARLLTVVTDSYNREKVYWLQFWSPKLFGTLFTEALFRRVVGDIRLSEVPGKYPVLNDPSMLAELPGLFFEAYSESEVRTVIETYGSDVNIAGIAENALKLSKALQEVATALKNASQLVKLYMPESGENPKVSL